MPRLFIGIFLPPDIRPSVQIPTDPDVRDVPLEQLHCTLRFMGSMDTEQTRDIVNRLEQVSIQPFDVRIKGGGMFGSDRTRWILWAGVHPTSPLQDLHDAIHRALGAEPERDRFTPHVTLGRSRRRSSIDANFWERTLDSLTSELFRIEGFDLVESNPDDKGTTYRVIRSFSAD